MSARKAPPTTADESWLASTLALAVAALVAILVLGGFWLQQTKSNDAALRHQADVYESYRESTRPSTRPVELPAAFTQAQQNREKLLSHPAVTPGPGFNYPGVQSTGVAIVDAIEQAAKSQKAP